MEKAREEFNTSEGSTVAALKETNCCLEKVLDEKACLQGKVEAAQHATASVERHAMAAEEERQKILLRAEDAIDTFTERDTRRKQELHVAQCMLQEKFRATETIEREKGVLMAANTTLHREISGELDMGLHVCVGC